MMRRARRFERKNRVRVNRRTARVALSFASGCKSSIRIAWRGRRGAAMRVVVQVEGTERIIDVIQLAFIRTIEGNRPLINDGAMLYWCQWLCCYGGRRLSFGEGVGAFEGTIGFYATSAMKKTASSLASCGIF
jgi:hypothetical protein